MPQVFNFHLLFPYSFQEDVSEFLVVYSTQVGSFSSLGRLTYNLSKPEKFLRVTEAAGINHGYAWLTRHLVTQHSNFAGIEILSSF